MLNIARNSAIDRLKSKSFQNDLQNQSIPDFVDDNKSLSTEPVSYTHLDVYKRQS